MESNAPKYQNKQTLANRDTSILMQTENNLQNLKGHHSSDSGSEHSISRAPLGLTLEDLEQPSYCEPRESVPKQRNMSLNGGYSLRRAQDKAGSLRNNEQEKLVEKLSSLREQNASLISQNHSLLKKMESVQEELAKSKSKVRFYESTFGPGTSRIPGLQEQIGSLKAESGAQEKALRIAEDKLLENRCIMAEKEQKFRNELKRMKIELYECNKLCKRAERQRNEALLNAEGLTQAFQQYKNNIADKLERIQAEGELRNKNFQNCEKERVESQEKCTKLENELENVKEHLRNLMSEKTDEREKQKCNEMKTAELISLLAQSSQRVLRLESELENKERVLEENINLLHETKELKKHLAEIEDINEIKHCESESGDIWPISKLQYDQVTFACKKDDVLKDVDNSDLDNSRSIVELRTQLKMKEAENRELQAKLLGAYNSDTLDAEPVKLSTQQIEEEKYLHLETVGKQLEAENERLTDAVKELQRKLGKAQAETTKTKFSMAQRTSQFQLIQEELLVKASKTTKLEQDMTKKSLKIATLHRLLEEKTQAYSSTAARNAELEEELRDVKAQIHHLEENISKEHKEVHLAFEKCKTIHLAQHNELLKQIEHLKCQLDLKNLQVSEHEFTIKTLQEDIVSKQQQLQSLDNLVIETRKEMDLQTKSTADAMNALENQLEDEAVKVRQLESALVVCKEELGLYLQKLEDNRECFENQVKKKAEEVQLLQKEIKLKTQSLQDTTEENLLLQQTLHQQQQMLQQGNARIGELEDTQTELQQQVSKLEFELEKHRSTSLLEMRATEGKLQAANQELACKTHQVHELSNTLNQVKHEFHLCTERLSQAEGQLVSVSVDGESRRNKLSQLEVTLQKTQVELHDKAQLVAVLQERILSAENNLKQKGEMELELQQLRKELQDNVKHVEELQETLTKTHMSVEEKQVMVQALTEELRTCKRELEERDLELLDMDQALKDRNWELKQRAAQLTQLDMSIRERKGEMEQKIIQLESTLQKSELEADGRIKQISSLDEKLQETRDQLREKDFGLLQKDQYINQLQKEMEKKQLVITEMDQTMKEQQRYISEQKQEGKDLSQQVRLAREGMQRTHLELVETQQQLAGAQKESDRLTHKLEEMDRLSREKLQRLEQDLDEAQDTICHLKTQLEARNEVIKATNEVLILKESELTRLKARISGYERSLVLKQQSNTSSLSPELFSDCREPESYKLPEASGLNWKMHSSISDISLNDYDSIDFPEHMMEDIKKLVLPDSSLARSTSDKVVHVPSDNLNDTSFNPLEYVVDDCDRTSDCPDLGTLSGMLKYIKQEMKLSEVAHSHGNNMRIEDGQKEQQD
ncbi:coiled-coil domain-containing protein 18 isoform X2 [Pseudophryne corroboree]